MSQREPIYMEPIVWVPGQGSDPNRLRDLSAIFPKPRIPLGEAWFMGKTRYMCDELNAHGIEGTSNKTLSGDLEDLISGLLYFPENEEWAQWYGYLAPRILGAPRFLDSGWHGSLCTGLLGLSLYHPDDYATRYEADFATVLSTWIMHSHFWNQGQYLPLRGKRSWRDSWGAYGIDYRISQSLLLTWRYLLPVAIQNWLHSVLAIKDTLWRAHFIIWLMRVWPFFEQGASNYPVLKQCDIEELWDDFYKINISIKDRPERQQWHLVSPENISAFKTAIREEFTERKYFEWIEQFAALPELWPQMEMWLEQMQEKFF